MERFNHDTQVWRDVDLEAHGVELAGSEDELIRQFAKVTREMEALVAMFNGRIEPMSENDAEATALNWVLEEVFPFSNGSSIAAIREFFAKRGVCTLKF